MLRLINEVLTMAPEFGADSMVATPLGAILNWTTGTPAGSPSSAAAVVVVCVKDWTRIAQGRILD